MTIVCLNGPRFFSVSELPIRERDYLEGDLVHTLSAIEIGEFASRRGAHEKDVESFLYTVGQPGTEEGALLNLYYDARLYNWNIRL